MLDASSAVHVAAMELIVGVAGAVNCGSLLNVALAADEQLLFEAVTV